MNSTLTRFLECSLAFMKNLKTLFNFNVYKGRVLQISSIYDKKCALKYVRLNLNTGQTAEFDAICLKFQNVFQKMENTIRF